MILAKFRNVKAVVLDVDGVLTDATVLVNDAGEQWRTFSVRDGHAIQQGIRSGLPIWAITRGDTNGVEKRLKGLGITEVFSGAMDKKRCLLALLERYAVQADDVLYMGDDMPDLPCLEMVGLPTCPADAAEEVKQVCQYISPKKGGRGAVRDVLEKVLKLQGKWG